MPAAHADPGRQLVELLTERGETLACAESLTAGLVAATVADTPGASPVLLGGVVAYAPQVKVDLLGVPADLIDRVGTVRPRRRDRHGRGRPEPARCDVGPRHDGRRRAGTG